MGKKVPLRNLILGIRLYSCVVAEFALALKLKKHPQQQSNQTNAFSLPSPVIGLHS